MFCHPVVSLSEISFQNGHTLWDRYNEVQITEPQWTTSITKPFAYTIGSNMQVSVLMTSSDVTGTVFIRYTVNGTWKNSTGQTKRTYSIDKDNGNGTFPYSLAHCPNAYTNVMDYIMYQSYDFYVRKSSSSDWCFAGEGEATHDKVYLTFGTPIGPWGTASNPRACWTRVIKDACTWMPEDGYNSGQSMDARNRLAYKAFWSSGKNYKSWDSHYKLSIFNMWDFIVHNWADCRDMSAWWVKLCNSLGLNGQIRRILGVFNTQYIDPIGTPIQYYGEPPWPSNGWGATTWNYHQVGWYNNVFDPCIQLNQNSPRVPQNENIDNPYKNDLFYSGNWEPQTPFSLSEVN